MFVSKRLLVFGLLTCLILTLIPFFFKFSVYTLMPQVHLKQQYGDVSDQIRSSTQTWTKVGCNKSAVWTRGLSEWFDDRYDASISPVWTRQNKILKTDVERWWLRIQHSNDPEKLQARLDTLFQIIPDDNPYSVGDPNRCLRCAVVGNSGNLRQSAYGKFIDEHEYVMRINVARTEGFEKDVGSRTTHRFMYPESYIEVKGETRFILTAFKSLDIEWLISALTIGNIERTYITVKKFIHANSSKIQVYNPALMNHIHNFWTELHGRYPSTGMLVLMFAMNICDQVNVFGYGATTMGNWDHYYNKPVSPQDEQKSAFRISGVHDGEFEAGVIKRLEEIGKITVFRGSRG
ncbi:CMP-N-acetylneuraminate-beta-galactosamide-alpha-2,3-sialyltransferase 2-like [Glandiceps talaboti]